MNTSTDSKVRLFLSNSASSLVTRVIQIVMLIWVNAYLIRRISPEEYSLLPLVTSLMVFAELLRPIFIGGVGRYIVDADAVDDHERVTVVVSSIFPVVLLVSLIFAGLGVLATFNLDGLVNISPGYLGDAQIMFAMLVFTFCLSMLSAPYSTGLYVRQRFTVQNAIDLGCELLRIALLIVLLLGVSAKVLWLVLASTIATCINTLIKVYFTRRLIPSVRFVTAYFDLTQTRKLVGFGAWNSLSNMASALRVTLPVLFLNRFASPLEVAAFHLGRLPEAQMSKLVTAASFPAQPALTSLHAQKGAEPLKDLYYRGGRYHLWLALLPLAPLMVFHVEVIRLYAGEQYAAASWVMFFLLARFPIAYSGSMYYRISHATGIMRIYAFTTTFSQLAIVAAVYLAVGVYGYGAAAAAAVIFATGVSLQIIVSWRVGLASIEGSWRRFTRETLVMGNAPFFAAVLCCLLYGSVTEVNTWISFGFISILSVAVYIGVLLLCCLDSVDKGLLQKVLKKLKKMAGM